MYQIWFLLSISHINIQIHKVQSPDYLYFKLKFVKIVDKNFAAKHVQIHLLVILVQISILNVSKYSKYYFTSEYTIKNACHHSKNKNIKNIYDVLLLRFCLNSTGNCVKKIFSIT